MDDLSKAMQEATAYLDRQKDERHPEKKPESKKTVKEVKPVRRTSTLRSKASEVQSNPTLVVAYGVAIALAIIAAGISTQWLVPALGASFGIATNIISKGMAATGQDSSWVIPVGAGGLALIGGVLVVFLLMRIVKHAASRPYLSVLPLLAVLAGFSVDMCKDFYPNLPMVRIGFAAVTSVLFVIGGLWWRRYGLLHKMAGTLLMLISAMVILAHGVSGGINQGLEAALSNVPTQSWMALGGLMTILVVTGLLAFTLRREIDDS